MRDPIIETMAQGSFEHERDLDERLAHIAWGETEMHAQMPQQLHRQYAQYAKKALETAGYEIRLKD